MMCCVIFRRLAMASLIGLTTTGLAAESTPARPNLVYKSPSGASFEITADGLSSIRFRGHELATGHWTAFAAEDWFNAGSNAVQVPTPTRKSMEVIGENHARVRQEQGDLVCIYDYTFDGEDVTVDARIENNNATHDLGVIGFSGLTFNFGHPPQGLMIEQHISYLQATGLGFLHPSFHDKIGGSYASDSSVGVGLSPWRMGPTRTLFLWDYTDWNPGKREKLPSRNLRYFVADPIPACGARTFGFRLRVSPDCDWEHLLEPYRKYFQATFGPVRYHADDRWIATDYLNANIQDISPANPYGFQEGHRRIDTPEGAAEFCDLLIPVLKTNDGQGVLIWGQAGEDPRGAMYRPDFDVLPPEVETQWPVIAARFRAAGLKLGVQTRPFNLAVRKDWQQDEVIAINVDDPGQREMLWRRFDNMIQKGCTLFYLDSFGGSLEDVKLMRWLRDKLGPDILTFVETECDAILPFSGGYTEMKLEASTNTAPPQYRLGSGLREWVIYQWLVPGAQLASRYHEESPTPSGVVPPDEFSLRRRITPLLPVTDFDRAPALGGLQRKFLNETNLWKSEY